MEAPDLSPPYSDQSRPSLGFPLGTALLILLIFALSGIFSCFYHWDKLTSLRPPASSSSSSPPKSIDLEKDDRRRERLTVVMPGDLVPRFIAMPCPVAPPRPEMVEVRVQKPPPRIAVPLY